MKISLKDAVDLLNHGEVVALPTETVYGLAASLFHPEAINKIFLLKRRPLNNPLIIHAGNVDHLSPFIDYLPSHFEDLSKAFWPGPMTLIVSADKKKVPDQVRAGLSTAAFRIPQHELTRQLLEKTGPLVMPSANLSGKPSGTCREHVESDFGISFPILDGGPCTRGLESTILYFQDGKWKIVRQGALEAETFAVILGYIPEIVEGPKTDQNAPLCPGQLYRHYAPKAKLILKKEYENELKGIILGFEDRHYPQGLRVISLGYLNNPETIAEKLYAVLRQIDLEEIKEVYVDFSFEQRGILSTIAERLHRAARD